MPNSFNASSAVAVAAVAVAILSFSQLATAQDRGMREQGVSASTLSGGIAERYPSGSIQSVESADRALADVQRERTRIDAEFANEERACYPKFFVTSCVDAAKERRRRALAQIQQVEVEANTFKRRARVEERDKALAEKAPKAAPIIKPPKEPKSAKPVIKGDQADRKQPADRIEEQKRAGEGTVTRDRVAQHKAKLERLKEKEAAEVQKRAENVAAFERKAREAEERQREVAARKAEKERERAKKDSAAAPASRSD